MEKVIHDPVHGGIRLDPTVARLLETAEVQRLRGVRQLGLASLVFPGANHTRFEHALGVAHLSRIFASELGVEEARLLQCAALLHDIGHPPFSHTLEFQMLDHTGKTHEQVALELIEGEITLASNLPTCGGVLRKEGIDPAMVCDLISGSHPKSYLSQLLHGEIDVDQMDYLLRDSHFTGVALGMIDLPRLRRVLRISRGRLVVEEDGIEAVEGFLTARNLMYSSVYFHRTVRIAELMLANAVELLVREGTNPYLLTEWQLFSKLEALGGHASEMVRRACYRELFKPVYLVERKKLSRKLLSKIKRMFGRWSRILEVQRELCELARVPEGSVILDVPLVELLVSEPRIGRVEISVLKGGKTVPLSKLSPLASALRERQVPRYLMQVAAPPEYSRRVRKATAELLGWLGENSLSAARGF
ncbi:MAG: HD domain-containing protein [Candidatus Hadarchaeales archaeon]